MSIRRYVVPATTDAAGAATVYSPGFNGKIISIRYVKTDFADGVTFNITAEATGETIWSQAAVNASVTVAPRQATHGTDGAAALFAVGGSAVRDHIILASDRVKIAITLGGNTKSGTFHILVG